MLTKRPIQAQEEPQYVDLSYLVAHIEDFEYTNVMTNGTTIVGFGETGLRFFLKAPDSAGISADVRSMPHLGLPPNGTVVTVIGQVYYSSQYEEWEIQLEDWWLQYDDWIIVRGWGVEMAIENKTIPLGEDVSIFMVALQGGVFPDTQVFDVYLYDSYCNLFSFWSQDKFFYQVITSRDPGYTALLRWDLYHYDPRAPPPLGNYYLVGVVVGRWGIPESRTTPILVRIEESTITPIEPSFPPGDVDGDGDIDALDLFHSSKTYGAKLEDANWKKGCDFNLDDKIDTSDLFDLGKNYGAKY